MSSFNRRLLLLSGFAAVSASASGCGFAPAYGPGGAAQGLRGRVRAADPTDSDSFNLVRAVEDRLGLPQAAGYDLIYKVNTEAEGAGITPSNAITRFSLVGSADWQLMTAGTDVVLVDGRAEAFTSWSATGNPISSLSAEDDARLRLMRILADQIVTQLIAASPRLPK
jgi:LPS-assembly lipoprotein